MSIWGSGVQMIMSFSLSEWPNKSLQATRDGRSSSAVAVHVIWSRVPELWTLGHERYEAHHIYFAFARSDFCFRHFVDSSSGQRRNDSDIFRRLGSSFAFVFYSRIFYFSSASSFSLVLFSHRIASDYSRDFTSTCFTHNFGFMMTTWPNKSLQATRDGRSSSASRFTSFGPACLSSGR